MGCGDACPVFPGKRYLDWELTDPAGLPVEGVRPIVDDIDCRVQAVPPSSSPRRPDTNNVFRLHRLSSSSIVDDIRKLDRESADRYAGWFKALSDPTRVQPVTLLATHGRPMTVSEIVSASEVGQSTVSHHLKALADVRFVLSEQTGTTRWYRINEARVSCFPSAADIVMGRQVLALPSCDAVPAQNAEPLGVRPRQARNLQ